MVLEVLELLLPEDRVSDRGEDFFGGSDLGECLFHTFALCAGPMFVFGGGGRRMRREGVL